MKGTGEDHDAEGRTAMHLVVVGATGGLGRDVVDHALRRGHSVRALVRHPERSGLPDNVGSVKGDVLDESSLGPAVRGCDAVICALGTASPRAAGTLLHDGTQNLVTVMTREHVSRLVCVTLLGVGPSRANAAILYRQLVLRALSPMLPDKENQERVVRESGLDWVLVRPPTFVRLRSRRPARVIGEGARGRVGLVMRDALADLLVRATEGDQYVGQAIVVGR